MTIREIGEGVSMKAIVDKETCIGCQLCVQICPEVFKMEGDKAVSYVNTVASKDENTCRQAADECPVVAITIEE